MSQIAWSYSRVNAMETCPRKVWHTSVAKDIVEPESDEMAQGTATHKAFEMFLKKAVPLPLHLRHHAEVLTRIASLPGEKSVEQQIALDANWQMTDWFSKGAWLRIKSDMTQLNGTKAVCWDWKTGKPKDDFTQLQLNGAVTMHLAPEIDEVTLAFYWAKTKQITKDKLTREQLPDFWGRMLKRVQVYQSHHDRQDFPPRPNYFCKGCCVTKCQYWQPKKG